MAQWRARLGSSSLLPIDGVKGGVDPDAETGEEEAPVGDILLKGVVVSEHYEVGQDDEDPPNEGDEIGS